MVVVALGEPGVPVVCWAPTGTQARTRNVAVENASVLVFMTGLSSVHPACTVATPFLSRRIFRQ
jgi:tetrahydromethanopterin S-methyltransferase subunit C